MGHLELTGELGDQITRIYTLVNFITFKLYKF